MVVEELILNRLKKVMIMLERMRCFVMRNLLLLMLLYLQVGCQLERKRRRSVKNLLKFPLNVAELSDETINDEVDEPPLNVSFTGTNFGQGGNRV